MPAAKAAKKAAPKHAKPAPGTKGTPDKPTKPRKVATAAKPVKPVKRAAKRPVQSKPKPAAPLTDPEPSLQWVPIATPTPTQQTPKPAVAAPRAFHPATGEWLPLPEPAGAPPQPAMDPAAYRPGVLSVLLHILLGIDLALFAAGLVVSLVTGAALVFAPDSPLAERTRDAVTTATPEGIALNTALNLIMFGLVPFIWVLGTRMRPNPGVWQYLRLRFGGRDWLRGLALVPAMLVAVALLSAIYIVATEGVDGLRTGGSGENPAVEAIVANLSWPLALFIALGAGVGEEIFFRGVLQRYLGVWGQGILFGLAHASGGYLPQILFAAGLGIVFGFLLKRGWSLWSLILAHFLYDFTLLSLALAFPEFG